MLVSQYGWDIDYVLDLPRRLVERLIDAIAEREFDVLVTGAMYQEAAISRSLAGAFGQESLPPWPTLEEVRKQIEDSELTESMGRLRQQAFV